MRTKGTGPQGLGIKGNNGYHIGSPAKFKAHKMYGKDGEVEAEILHIEVEQWLSVEK